MNEVIVSRMTHIMFYWQPCLRFAGKQLSSGLGNLQGGEQVGDKLGGEEHTHNLGREEHTNNLGGEDYTGLADKLWQDWRRNSCSAPLVSTALCVQRSPSMFCFVAIWSTHFTWEIFAEHAFQETRPVWAKNMLTCRNRCSFGHEQQHAEVVGVKRTSFWTKGSQLTLDWEDDLFAWGGLSLPRWTIITKENSTIFIDLSFYKSMTDRPIMSPEGQYPTVIL